MSFLKYSTKSFLVCLFLIQNVFLSEDKKEDVGSIHYENGTGHENKIEARFLVSKKTNSENLSCLSIKINISDGRDLLKEIDETYCVNDSSEIEEKFQKITELLKSQALRESEEANKETFIVEDLKLANDLIAKIESMGMKLGTQNK